MRMIANHMRRHWVAWAIATASALLTLAVYGATLSFPFIFDDLIHLRWLAKRGVWDVWVNIEGMQHYRPLVMWLWAVSMRAFGATASWPLHLLTLALHIANACLVGWLARRVIPNAWAAIAAAAFFALYPFSYQAIPSPGSHSKPMSAFLLLLACWLYWRGRERRRRGWIAAALGAALFAPFAYESAITSGGYLVLIEYLLWRKGKVARPSPWVLGALLAGVPFLAAWLAVPNSGDAPAFPGWEALAQSGVYFAQALAWPLAALAKAGLATARIPVTRDLATAAWAAFPFLALVMIWRRRSPALVAALGWAALSLGVMWVTLSFRYVIDGPRILYPAAPGAALLWADLLAALASGAGRWRWGRMALTGLIAAAMLGWGARFIGQRMALCRSGVAALEQAADLMVAAPEGERLLFVNTPAWLTPRDTDFPLGHEGYLLLPPYYDTDLDDYVRVNRGVDRPVMTEALTEIRQDWPSGLIGYHDDAVSIEKLAQSVRKAGRVWVLGYTPDRLLWLDAGSARLAEREEPPQAIYGEAIGFYGASAEIEGDVLVATLRWRELRNLEGPYTAFVHLYAADGRLVAQGDGAPLRGVFPFGVWKNEYVVEDVRELALPPDLPAGRYTLGVGIYRADNGERVPAAGADGRLLADAMVRQTVDK